MNYKYLLEKYDFTFKQLRLMRILCDGKLHEYEELFKAIIMLKEDGNHIPTIQRHVKNINKKLDEDFSIQYLWGRGCYLGHIGLTPQELKVIYIVKSGKCRTTDVSLILATPQCLPSQSNASTLLSRVKDKGLVKTLGRQGTYELTEKCINMLWKPEDLPNELRQEILQEI